MCSSFREHTRETRCGDPDNRDKNEIQASSETGTSKAATSEDFSDIRDDSDIFHLTVDPDNTWITVQDKDEAKIAYIAPLLHCNPLVPPDPDEEEAERDWEDVQSGVALARAQCAFRGCVCVNDSKDSW